MAISQLLLRQTQLRGVVCFRQGFSERYQQMTGNLLTPAAIVPWHNVVMLVPCSRWHVFANTCPHAGNHR